MENSISEDDMKFVLKTFDVDIIQRFKDVKDIYSNYLESGGEYDD